MPLQPRHRFAQRRAHHVTQPRRRSANEDDMPLDATGIDLPRQHVDGGNVALGVLRARMEPNPAIGCGWQKRRAAQAHAGNARVAQPACLGCGPDLHRQRLFAHVNPQRIQCKAGVHASAQKVNQGYRAQYPVVIRNDRHHTCAGRIGRQRRQKTCATRPVFEPIAGISTLADKPGWAFRQ